MAAARPLPIQGIESVFERVLINIAGARRPLAVEKLRVRDAAPLMMMMEVARDAAVAKGEEAWTLHNTDAVQAMAAAATILKVVEAAVIPKLRSVPTGNGNLAALALFAGTLRDEAAVAGGSFQVMMVAAAASIDNYVADARAHAPRAKLLEAIDELERHFRSIAEKTYTLRQPAPAAAAN